MDMNVHPHDPGHAPMGPTPSSSRKRARENETPSQRHKREKAAERQRRKRERDRQAGMNNLLALQQVQAAQQVPVEQALPEPQVLADAYKPLENTEEEAKRERVRAAARERQRKHRALVKARKLRELGLDMGNEIIPGMEEQYGQYPVMPHEMPPHPPHPHGMEPPFPDSQPPGQMFASTLLLSFSCAPLLKQHLLRSLNMTNDELASLEPILAQAWEQWNHQRRMAHFHHANGHKGPDGGMPGDPNAPGYPVEVPHPYVHDPSQAPPNDFRARFHRPLVAPSPFSAPPPAQAPSSSASASAGPSGDGGASPAQGESVSVGSAVVSIDPQLGQARDEAAGVAGKLER